jgi:hypothetical protein
MRVRWPLPPDLLGWVTRFSFRGAPSTDGASRSGFHGGHPGMATSPLLPMIRNDTEVTNHLCHAGDAGDRRSSDQGWARRVPSDVRWCGVI